MIEIRRSEGRGRAQHGWLDSYHTFSFADYYDAKYMGFRSLRVINEDHVAPGRGFGAHGHRDMEILSYVLSGLLAHKDSMGHTEVLGPNEIQRMSAGGGVVHSEFNGSETESVHFLQIWIEPASYGGMPGYEQVRFTPEEKQGKLKLLAGPEGANAPVTINQDAKVFVSELKKDDQITYDLSGDRYAWVQIIRGSASVNDTALKGGDAAALTAEDSLRILAAGMEPTELLLFDLA
jgi:redox-sensitive bicupin YhaK (pirin superfamily)